MRGTAADAGCDALAASSGDAGLIPLSAGQERLWFLDRLVPGIRAYHVPLACRLTGALDVKALSRALDELLRRHEALRVTFRDHRGKLAQTISPASHLPIRLADLQALEPASAIERARALASLEFEKRFDLRRGPLLRALLIQLSSTDHVLVLTIHHIVCDGWSLELIKDELSILYRAFVEGRDSPLPPLQIGYGNYMLGGAGPAPDLREDLQYWRRQLSELPPPLEIHTGRPRPSAPSYRGALERFALAPDVSAALKQFARTHGLTLFMTLLGAFNVLLHKYAGIDDILVGTPVAIRRDPAVERLVGLFLNNLVIRTRLRGDPSFRELMVALHKTSFDAYAHQAVSFESLVRELAPARDLSRHPVFQTTFQFLNVPSHALELAGLSATPFDAPYNAARFDLEVHIYEHGDGLEGILAYSTDLYEPATAQRMVGHYLRLLQGIAEHPDRRLSELPMLAGDERRRLLEEWNATSATYPSDRCLHQLFEAQVERTPDAVAVVYQDERLSYGELNRRANQVAHRLQRLGVGPEVVVGICLPRSLEMVVGVLGILKAGGAYLPLDPEYPPQRLRFMVEDGGAGVVLTSSRLTDVWSEVGARIVRMDAPGDGLDGQLVENPQPAVTARNLAYVIYTSGSTGKPKGVAVEHSSLANLWGWLNGSIWDRGVQRVGMNGSMSFDGSVKQLVSLLSGHQLHVIPEDVREDAGRFRQYLLKCGISTLDVTPSQLRMLRGAEQANLATVTHLLVGGEALDAELLGWLNESHGLHVINCYGPTETTVDATAQRSRGQDTSIGRPIANTRMYVLDRWMEPVPIGIVGELYVGGAGLARGYLGRAGLTAERFLPDPFGQEPGGRLYRTGDLGRYREDGDLEFIGRIDQQVKLRGYRIELGEIEAVLLEHPEVRDAVVLARGAGGSSQLVAYVVGEGGKAPRVQALREHLERGLPRYMVPAVFVMLTALPLTPSGKVDRRALPEPEGLRAELADRYEAPRTAVETALARIWRELLGVERVGIHDSFFELGGHSLLATLVVSRTRDALGAEVELRAVMEKPTIGELGAVVEEALRTGRATALPPIRIVDR